MLSKKSPRFPSLYMNPKKVELQFNKAYKAYNDAIFRFCYYRVFDREIAKELTQETFMRTWKNLTAGGKIDNIRAFLYRVARNAIIDHSRKKKEASLDNLREQGIDFGMEIEKTLQDGIDNDSAVEAIKKLDDIYREALLLRFVDGFGPKEISEMLNETQNVISVRLNRGLKQLQSRIQKTKI